MQLGRARAALERAHRLIEELDGLQGESTAFQDHVPGVLAQLDAVSGVIDDETDGSRTAEFGAWWSRVDKSLKSALHDLRNVELKQQLSQTSLNAVIQPATVQVGVTIGGTIIRARAGSVPLPSPQLDDSAVATGRMFWTFSSGPLNGKEVLPTLRSYESRLRDEVIPEAERLQTPHPRLS